MVFKYKQLYRRKLPHIHSPGATLFITFRLKGSVPKSVIEKWKAERVEIEEILSRNSFQADVPSEEKQEKLKRFRRRWFALYEEILHKEAMGPLWLKDPSIAEIVEACLRYLDGTSYQLHAYCIMSNHVHVVFTPLLNERSLTETKESGRPVFLSEDPTLAAIMQSIKGYSARQANKLLGRRGQFWEPESYDHEVRNENEFWRIVDYVLKNPVKAGLVSRWNEWPYSWVAEDLGIRP